MFDAAINGDAAAEAEAGRQGVVMPHEMSCARYMSEAITICVYPAMERGRIRLICADEDAEQAYQGLVAAFARIAPAGEADAAQWADGVAQRLFENTFSDDVWYSNAGLDLGLSPIVLVKKDSIEGAMSLEEAMRRIHLEQIARALNDGLTVPDEVLNEYRAKLDAMSVVRELS